MSEKITTFIRQTTLGWKQDILILIVLQVALGLVYIKTVPRFYLDEAWVASIGHSIAYEGRLRHGIIEGWGGMHIHFVQNQIVLPWICAVIYRLAGFGVTTSRIAAVLMSVLAVTSIYRIIRHWFGREQAVLTGLATILHPWFFVVSRTVRPEICYIALALAAMSCLIRSLESGRRQSAFFAGGLAGLAMLSHPTGVILIFAIFCGVIIWLRSQTIKRTFLWVAVGFAIPILPYALYVLWCIQDPQISFYEQMMVSGLQRSLLAGEITRWRHFLQWPIGAPLAIIMAVSWFFAWYDSTPGDKILATVITIFSIVLPFATVNQTSRYLVALSPLFCGLLVRLVWRMLTTYKIPDRSWLNHRFIGAICIAGVYLAMSIMSISIMFHRLYGANLYKLLDRVAVAVERGAHIYGEMIFWMERDRFRYGPYPIEFRDGNWHQDVETVNKYHFDYAVRTAWLFNTSHGVASPPADMPAFRSSLTLDEVCSRFGTKIDEFRDPYFGPVEIYKLKWGNNPDS